MKHGSKLPTLGVLLFLVLFGVFAWYETGVPTPKSTGLYRLTCGISNNLAMEYITSDVFCTQGICRSSHLMGTNCYVVKLPDDYYTNITDPNISEDTDDTIDLGDLDTTDRLELLEDMNIHSWEKTNGSI